MKLKSRKGKTGLMVIKKLKIEWDFVSHVLEFFEFLKESRRLIIQCVLSPRISILFNGGKLSQSYPSTWLRQGDSSSSYLFIQCMGCQSIFVEKEARQGGWKGLKASRHM